ncbi:hypothetical protein [Acinetobacter bereziniae]|uniref:hypothetical protein n=1 Tax=Acinetobacter bereziniae TaxID=106648 RepID=UPI00125046C3|nr:hypothetical protein [Acinetobacter bereziniae]
MKKMILMGIFTCLSFTANATDYKAMLTGKNLLLKNSCAGISLTKKSGAISELPLAKCVMDFPMRVRWLSNDTFMMVETVRPNETSPPRVFVYKVKSVNGNKAVISEIWAGWNNFPDEDVTYTISK